MAEKKDIVNDKPTNYEELCKTTKEQLEIVVKENVALKEERQKMMQASLQLVQTVNANLDAAKDLLIRALGIVNDARIVISRTPEPPTREGSESRQ